MLRPIRHAASALCLSLAAIAGAGVSAEAYTWPGTVPSLGGVIAAKAIGEVCPGILSRRNVAELDRFLTRYMTEIRVHRPAEVDFHITFVPSFTKTMRERRATPGGCGASDREQAKDMLKRVRATRSDERYWAEVRHPSPRAGPALHAKVVAEKCPGALPDGAAQTLQRFIDADMAAFARTATPQDTEETWSQLRKAAQAVADAMTGPEHCTAEATEKARATFAAVEKRAGK